MRVRGRLLEAVALWPALFASTALVSLASAAKDKPTITATTFDNEPYEIQYFPDSDVILIQDVGRQLWRSPDAGATWHKVEIKGLSPNYDTFLVMHEFDANRAYLMTSELVHYKTHDKGETWKEFFIDSRASVFRYPSDIMHFHASDPDRIIWNGMDCDGIFCDEVAMYTIDGFSTDGKFLRGNTNGCWWAKSSKSFTTGEDDLDKQRALCIIRDPNSLFKQDQRLVISDNYFGAKSADGTIQEFEPNLNTNKPVQGIVNIAAVKKYLLVATSSMNTDEMGLYITDDTLKWHRAVFTGDHRINQEAYTVLESTDYSIQIDVMNTRPSNPMGVMFTSNSNGTYFTRNVEHTNRNTKGHVDFEKISGIDGIYLVNTIDNWKEVEASSGAQKKKVTSITFDDGRTFHNITADGKNLHLHSVTELSNIGRVFSSPAPGLVMGIGNTGDFLKGYLDKETALWVSDDAGLNWYKGADGPHKYEFGDSGGILVAVEDSDGAVVRKIKYSINHGQDWQEVEIAEDEAKLKELQFKPWALTTSQGSTGLKFLLFGETSSKYVMFSIDFEGLHEATCKESDMEDWWARVDEDGKPTCVMGQKQRYHRRKKDAKCFVNGKFKDPVAETEPCECTDQDFECDYNFVRDGDECKQAGPLIAPEGACKNVDDTFKGSSGWRLIPGNACKRRKSEKDDPVERKCSDTASPPTPPGSGKVEHGDQTVFDGDFNNFRSWYLERGDSNKQSDETIIMRPVKRTDGGDKGGSIYITHDHGKTWEEPDALKGKHIWGIIPHPHIKDMVFFIPPGANSAPIYTIDRGRSFHNFEAPKDTLPGDLAFHPDKKDWLIWVGKKCDKDGNNCQSHASLSTDRGDRWDTIAREVYKCEFTGSAAYKHEKRSEKQIACMVREGEKTDGSWQLKVSNDFFKEEDPIIVPNITNFATMAEFIVVATQDQEKDTLHPLTSLDGVTFAEAHFPYGFDVPHQREYTVLDSSTHAINLFVTTETTEGHRYGSIMKSNSNGTSYVLSIPGVNCNDDFLVDFEKMLGLEGVALINTVANRNEKKGSKKLQTQITHNDGAKWAYLTPPAKDVDGKPYPCKGKGDSKCALHIHGYTERADYHKTFSSESAIGLMFGLGNVGQYLGAKSEADTFMTTDAGITWTNVQKGQWMWQYGDQGSIIVLAQVGKSTKTIKYTVDEGRKWEEWQFSDDDITITDVTTLRSGASRNFLIWGMKDGKVVTINIDFSGLADRECDTNEDYYFWSPKHPFQNNNCLFGHQSQYRRKKTDAKCYNGFRIQHQYNVRNCTCERTDFECDYNFELDKSGGCKLVKGLQPITADEACASPDQISYWDPSGYRRIPLTTCVGGKEMDKQTTEHPCKGHEKEFEKQHRASGFGVFLAITLPFIIAGGVGWWVYNNWNGKFGQIRLGDQASLDTDRPWVKYPIMAVAGIVAVISAMPLVVGSLWRSAKSTAGKFGIGSGGGYTWIPGGGGGRTFTTRDSFARGRSDYAIVDEDEGELLGEESDEDAA